MAYYSVTNLPIEFWRKIDLGEWKAPVFLNKANSRRHVDYLLLWGDTAIHFIQPAFFEPYGTREKARYNLFKSALNYAYTPEIQEKMDANMKLIEKEFIIRGLMQRPNKKYKL